MAPGGIHDCPNRWVFSRLLNVFSDRLLSRSADVRLFHTVGLWKAKPRWPTDVCTLGRSIHPADAECSRGRPWTFSTGTQNSCRYGARPPGIPFREFPGIVMCWIQGGNSREFVRFRRELRGIHRSFVFCLIFVADHDIFSVLTHSTTQAYCLFLSKTFSDVLNWPNFLAFLDSRTSKYRYRNITKQNADRSGQLTTCKTTFWDFAQTDR